MISHYLLDYFPGLDIERRNCHGFSALMKAAMQGRADCVRALMLAGTAPFLYPFCTSSSSVLCLEVISLF